MKKAIIDMGSNSIRLLLAEIEEKHLIQAEKQLAMTRLGEGVDSTKLLNERSMSETIEAVRRFKAEADDLQYELLGAFATSAVRDAQNGTQFTNRVLLETGVPVTVISGEREALLGYKGVLAGLSETERKETFAIIDIGGGSTEVIISHLGELVWRHSFNLGAVRMTGKHLHHLPPEDSEIIALSKDIESVIAPFAEALCRYEIKKVIGIGGTATTFAAMTLEMAEYDRQLIQGAFTSKKSLNNWVRHLRLMSLAERKRIIGLQPKRADIIYAGGIILEKFLELFGTTGFFASDYDNLEGLLVEEKIL